MQHISIYVDGATAGTRHVGIAAIACTARGEFVAWRSQRLSRMTNNEAEYHATLLGLELAKTLGLSQVEIVSDSEVVVRQMRGLSRVNSNRLKVVHKRTCTAVAQFRRVTFRHVRRAENRLADALAANALEGRLVGDQGTAQADAETPPRSAGEKLFEMLAALGMRSDR